MEEESIYAYDKRVTNMIELKEHGFHGYFEKKTLIMHV